MANGHGGKRPGAGKPKGYKHDYGLGANEQKALARDAIRAAVAPHVAAIVRAQVENAQGVSYLVLRAPDGSYVRATDEKQLDAALASGSAAFRIYTKEPHHGSASMLLAYAADKPVEPVEVAGKDGGPLIVKWKE